VGFLTFNVRLYFQGVVSGSWGRVPKHRLEVRLSFLMRRFDGYSPHWQLVIWGRQLALVAITSEILSAAVPSSAVTLWVRVGFSFVVLILSWLAHALRQPFMRERDNTIESGLMASAVAILAFGCGNEAVGRHASPAIQALVHVVGTAAVILPP